MCRLQAQKTRKTKEKKTSWFYRRSSLCVSPPGLGPETRTVFPQICKELEPPPALSGACSACWWPSSSQQLCSDSAASSLSLLWWFLTSFFVFFVSLCSAQNNLHFLSISQLKKAQEEKFMLKFCSQRSKIWDRCLSLQGSPVVQDSCWAASLSCQVFPRHCWIFRV